VSDNTDYVNYALCPEIHPEDGCRLSDVVRSMWRLMLLAGFAGIPYVACTSSGRPWDGGMPAEETGPAEILDARLMPTDGGDSASGDVAMDEAALDVAMDINLRADDAKDTVSSEDAECYPGLAANCMVAVPAYNPCDDPACQGYSRFCINGKWSWIHCDPIVEPPLAGPDAAVESVPVDTGPDSLPVDQSASLDSPGIEGS